MSVLASLAVATVLNISAGQIESIAALAENCVHKPNPYAMSHVLQSADDVQTPQSLYPDTAMADRAKVLLAQSLTAENLAGELTNLGRRSLDCMAV